jgi:hypothetical protein
MEYVVFWLQSVKQMVPQLVLKNTLICYNLIYVLFWLKFVKQMVPKLALNILQLSLHWRQESCKPEP